MKFGIIGTTLLVLAVSATGSQAYAASEAKVRACNEKLVT